MEGRGPECVSFGEQSKKEGLKGLGLANFVGEFHHTQIWFIGTKQPER